eukprot:CAMPEP_0118672524 /NCGR_PEP_ID=MMETSP0785-20121206/22587_1 /TAXON_ID=91992 /ORGANISM="Bolidomonas pacifica, Strain CCMP 1866" /LENGTH=443 /DNA_ID=CAMNT_0006567493 /DNA_START=30 /DNA_END=1357 /DNA_ORIENTATION=-
MCDISLPIIWSGKDEKMMILKGHHIEIRLTNSLRMGWQEVWYAGDAGTWDDDFFIDPIIAQSYPSYRLNKLAEEFRRRLEEASEQGSNCLEVGGGYSPKYSLCEGCMISSALACIDDMRHNMSMNVRGGCDLSAMMVEPQPECCTKFSFPNTGVEIIPKTAAYNDALLCLERANCMCLDGGLGCGDDKDAQHDIYKNLQEECESHTVHSDCRTSCDIWIHDGEVPEGGGDSSIEGDCQEINEGDKKGGGCWKYFPPPSPPIFMSDDDSYPQCAPGTEKFNRYRDGGIRVNGRIEVRGQYDWWQCWYVRHCTDGSSRLSPPLASVKTGELLTFQNCSVVDGGCESVYGVSCSPAQLEEYHQLVAEGKPPEMDCDKFVPSYCDPGMNTEMKADGSIVQTPRGINIPPDTVTKNEDINCKVDKYACLATKSAAPRSQISCVGWTLT